MVSPAQRAYGLGKLRHDNLLGFRPLQGFLLGRCGTSADGSHPLTRFAGLAFKLT